MKNTMKLMSAMAALTLSVGCADGPPLVGPSPSRGPSSIDIPSGTTGSGNVVTESKEVSGFHGVSLAGAGRLVIEHTGAESLTITADDNILPLLTSEVRNGWLVLSTQPGSSFSNTTDLVYRVTVAHLSAVDLPGAASAEIYGIDAASFSVELAGAARATAAGRADTQTIQLAGAASYDAGGLDSRAVQVDLAGSCRALVRANESLEGRVNGASTLEYIGDPTVSVETSSDSTVRQVGS